MKDVLPNFIRADSAMSAAETFFHRAAGACDVLAQQSGHESHEELFLSHAAQACSRLSETLAHSRTGPRAVACDTFVQYAPSGPMPGDAEIDSLRSAGSVEAAHEQLARAADRWLTIFDHFQKAAESEDATRLNAACHDQVATWQRKLASSYSQAQDL